MRRIFRADGTLHYRLSRLRRGLNSPRAAKLNRRTSLNVGPSWTPKGVPFRSFDSNQPKTVTSYDGRLLLMRPDPRETKRRDRLPA